MVVTDIRLQPLTRRRVDALGDVGEVWLSALPARLADLCARWDLTLGRSMPGGSASYVVAAVDATGADPVLKVALPGHPVDDEARLLRAADGWGYAHLLDHHDDALLLEQLGTPMEFKPMPPGAKLDRLVDTLNAAWTVATDTVTVPPGPSGRAKAESLTALVEETDDRLGRVCDPDVRAVALQHAARRAADFEAPLVVVHGDPHPANALQVRAPRRGAESGWCFVDPDGFACDPAYDLGVLLRDWSGRLLDLPPEEARLQLRRWCLRVVERSGLGIDAVDRAWEWAFLERVSTGLHVLDFGAEELGTRFLRSAAHLLT